MRAKRIKRTLRLGATAVAGAAVVATGGSLAAQAGPSQPCDDGSLPMGAEVIAPTVPCVAPPPPTPVETQPPSEPPPTETVDPPPPPTLPADRPRSSPPPAPAPKTPSPATKPAPVPPQPVVPATPIAPPPDNGMPALSGGPYVFPVLGPVSFTDSWGAPRATVAWHHGVDIFAPMGAPVVAVADGTLFSVGWNAVGGRRLWLRDRAGNYFYYAHLSGFAPGAVEGARVRVGTVIGYVGTTGDAVGTPPHLHFEIHPASLLSLGYDGAVNPFPYVSAWQRSLGDGEGLAGAATSGASDAAPTPGAILLGYTDISSASGLAPAPLAESIDGDEAAAVVVHELAAVEASPPPRREAALSAAREADALVARSLDEEAKRRPAHGDAVWDRLALCEAGGDWSANTGNGYFGGLQFHHATWVSHGGAAFAASADLATREEQIIVAGRVLRTQGWAAWPVCSALLGLSGYTGR